MPKLTADQYYKVFDTLAPNIYKGPIKKFKFRLVEKEREYISHSFTYRNKTTALKISYEFREYGKYGLFILISRLVNDQIPGYEIFINDNTIINSFYLGDFIEIRSPNPAKEFPLKYTIHNIEGEGIRFDEKTFDQDMRILEKLMREYAKALKKYASDVLAGDFTIFSKLEKIVKKRAKKIVEEDTKEHEKYMERIKNINK